MTNPLTPIEGTAVTDNSNTTDTSYANEYDYDYCRIASELRLSKISICLYGLAFFARIIMAVAMIQVAMAGDSATIIANIFNLLTLGAIIFSIICMVRLAKLLHYGNGSIALFAICILSPILGFIPLFAVYCRAGHMLGHWKASLFFRADGRMTDEFLGVMLGLALTVIVFGFVFLFFWAR